MRFPAFHVEETGDGYRVSISDVRYARRPGGGFGATVVDLDRELRVRSPGPADAPGERAEAHAPDRR